MDRMITITLLTVGILFLLYSLMPNKDRKEPYLLLFIAYGLISMITIVMTTSMKFFLINPIFLIAMIVLSLYLINKMNKYNEKTLNIVAKQVSFWDISVDRVIEKYKDRIVNVNDRKEIKKIEEQFFFKTNKKGDKELEVLKYLDIKEFNRFTVIKSTKFFNSDKCPVIYKVIWKKFLLLDKEFEKFLDFEEILKENGFILQFFFIDLWGRLAKNEVLGIATLEVEAKNQRELELLGAMDSEKNSNVQLLGFELYCHYLNFKGYLKSIDI